MTVDVLARWFYGALARRFSDCLLQQGLPGFEDGGAMTTSTDEAALCALGLIDPNEIKKNPSLI